ncbi:GNAT family N-acetyltransferase [Dyadobacter arcticus]|uniref:GNAT superfamily N-acetyltransferase n=1 Tax=Dyadobacter arcticus TaxID=1078754 RepID=A0ABX0UMJ0_9BACT|nr:GNAT family N-acetyltransferase [Dyadobacter arcticus]NIJ54227.1 GNAT superfamily N-acetyltransferase [Dyadobacter arcticus]
MPSFTIKHATLDDIPDIIAIQEKTWEPTYGEILSKEQIDYMFEKIYSHEALTEQFNQGQHFMIILNDGRPEGFASVSEEKSGKFKLHKIYLLPSSQGSGAGKYLLGEAENYVRLAGGKVLFLNVNKFNKAKTFYERMGYEVVAEKDIPIGPYWMNDFILEKQLDRT